MPLDRAANVAVFALASAAIAAAATEDRLNPKSPEVPLDSDLGIDYHVTLRKNAFYVLSGSKKIFMARLAVTMAPAARGTVLRWKNGDSRPIRRVLIGS